MPPRSHGTGRYDPAHLASLGVDTVIEEGVLIFHAGHVHIGNEVYIGHRAMLRGDTRGELTIGDGSWIGHEAYFQSAGGVRIGARVGVGPKVAVISSAHRETPPGTPIMDAPLEFAPVEVGDGCDIGVAAVLLPGTRLGEGVQVGAGAVVSGEFEAGTVVAGVPARMLRRRRDSPGP